MSVTNFCSKFTCDLCGKEETSKNYPSSFCKITYDGNRSGFSFFGSIDACETCAPSKFFSDPPKQMQDETLLNKIFSFLLKKRKDKFNDNQR